MNLIQQLEAEAIEQAVQGRPIPEFRPGDTVRIGVRVVEGERTRVQNFEGVCIARANRGLGSSFTVRKISFGRESSGLPAYSPNIETIEVVRGAPSAAPSSIICAADRQGRPNRRAPRHPSDKAAAAAGAAKETETAEG